MAGDHQEASPGALDLPALLALCDRAVGEVGRRRHMFSWLRAPGADSGEWLAVDSYYPGNRLVVMCRDRRPGHVDAFTELVPAHGLRLLELSAGQLGSDPADAEAVVRRMVADLALPPRPRGFAPDRDEGPPRPSAISRIATSFARPNAAAAAVAHDRPGDTAAMGLAVGLALAAIAGAELYLGVGRVALNGSHWLLAFGIAIDVCARALGTIAAARAGRPDWTWWCVIGGSPVVTRFALQEASDGAAAVEPGPLAGLLAMLACGTIALAVVLAVLKV